MVTMNYMGTGEVVGYFMAKGEDNNAYTGVVVLLDTPPIWYLKQNSGCRLAWVFGREVRSIPIGYQCPHGHSNSDDCPVCNH
jgi:hypothetical protein